MDYVARFRHNLDELLRQMAGHQHYTETRPEVVSGLRRVLDGTPPTDAEHLLRAFYAGTQTHDALFRQPDPPAFGPDARAPVFEGVLDVAEEMRVFTARYPADAPAMWSYFRVLHTCAHVHELKRLKKTTNTGTAAAAEMLQKLLPSQADLPPDTGSLLEAMAALRGQTSDRARALTRDIAELVRTRADRPADDTVRMVGERAFDMLGETVKVDLASRLGPAVMGHVLELARVSSTAEFRDRLRQAWLHGLSVFGDLGLKMYRSCVRHWQNKRQMNDKLLSQGALLSLFNGNVKGVLREVTFEDPLPELLADLEAAPDRLYDMVIETAPDPDAFRATLEALDYLMDHLLTSKDSFMQLLSDGAVKAGLAPEHTATLLSLFDRFYDMSQEAMNDDDDDDDDDDEILTPEARRQRRDHKISGMLRASFDEYAKTKGVDAGNVHQLLSKTIDDLSADPRVTEMLERMGVGQGMLTMLLRKKNSLLRDLAGGGGGEAEADVTPYMNPRDRHRLLMKKLREGRKN